MSHNNENTSNVNDELSKVNLSLYEYSIELWRLEEKCRLKSLSIDNIEKSTIQVNIENKWLENQLMDKKSRIEEVKECIVSMDNIIFSFYETLAHLEVEYKKKESSINKTKNDYELQLFIKMELWQKEEERFDNIPEVKSLKTANLELNNIKLEYEELLDCKKNLTEKIKKAEEQNDENLKDAVVEFSKVYVEMLTLNNRENNCRTLLRKLEIEYTEKLKTKNELLELSKKKVNKTSFWTHNFCPFDSKMIDIKLDSLNQGLKTHLKYYNSYDYIDIQKYNIEEILKSNNNLKKKKVTFLLSPEDQISYTNSNSSLLEDSTIVNTSSTQEFQKYTCGESSNKNFNDNEKRMNEHDFDFQTNKLKIIEENDDFEFKKPLNPIQQENQMNRNLTLKNVQPITASSENIYTEKNVDEHQDKVQSLNLTSNNYKHIGSYLDNDVHLQERSSLESVQQSNLKNFTDENSKIFGLQSNETLSEPNNTFSGLNSNDYSELGAQTSSNISFYSSDVSELFGNPYDTSQYSNMQLNFSNSFNTNLRAATVSNLQESNLRNPQESDLCLNDYIDQSSQNSTNSSFRGSDLSELFGNSYSISQYPNMQLNFSNSFNANSIATTDSNLQELNVKNSE